MKHLIIAGITGLAVTFVGYGTLEALSSEPWRDDLLALEAVPEPPPPEPVRKGRGGRRGRRKPKGSAGKKSAPRAATTTTTPAKAAPTAVKPAEATGKAPTRSKADEHYLRSGAYLKEKKVGLAIQELERCMAIDPGYALAYRSMGIAQTLLGREKLATQYFEKFVKLAPKHRDTARIKQIIADYYERNPK